MINDIKEYTMRDYKEAISNYIALLKKSDDIIGIYQIGSIKTLGISDIDLVIVLKDSLNKFNFLDYSIKNLSKKDQYLFMHEPFIINYSHLENIKSLFPIFNLKETYWNNNFKRKKFKKSNFKNLSEYFFLSYLLRGYYFKKSLKSLRTFLAIASLSKYSLQIIYSLIGKKPRKKLEETVKFILDKKKNYRTISEQDMEILNTEYNLFNEIIINDYVSFLSDKGYKRKFIISLVFFPKIILFLPIKTSVRLGRFISLFPIQIHKRLNGNNFLEIRKRLIEYNKWIYKNNLQNFSIFTIQYKTLNSVINKIVLETINKK